MTNRIPQSTTKLVVFKAYLASDHTTEATGKTIAITISKNGGAFGNPNAGATNATEITSGWYKVSLDTTDTGTLGPLAVRGAVALIDDVGVLLEVVSATSGGYTNLDAAISGRMATYTQPTGFLAATFPSGTVANTTNITAGTITTVTTVTNQLTASAIATGVWTDTTAGDFTTSLSVGKSVMNGVSLGTGLTVAAVTGLTASDVGSIKAQTDNLTFDGANMIVADARKISTSATAADNLEAGALALVPSTCSTGSTTTSIVTNLTEATDDHYNGRVISFTSGALAGQASNITDYNGTTKTLTVTALTESPANTDGFVIS